MNRSRPKVRFIAESLNVGGAEKALVSILKAFDYSRFDVTLTLISQSGGFVKELDEIPGITVKSYVKPAKTTFGRFFNSLKIKAIYSWLPARIVGNYLCGADDVVVAFCEGFLTKWVGASTKMCRKIAWVHTDMVMNDWPLKTGVFPNLEAEKLAYHNFDEVVAVSSIVASGMTEKFQCKSLMVIYNIIDKDIRLKANAFRPDIPRFQFNIVSVGRLEYVKGYDLLLEAMNILVNNKHLDIHLTLVGDGSERQGLERYVDKCGLERNVSFAGMQPNPYPYINAADLFVCPSRQEGFNIAILEAMTLGKPIVATNSAGPSEILAGGQYGLLTKASSDGLAEGIIKGLTDYGLHGQFKSLSIERASFFSGETQMNEIAELFNK
ncbi:MAG: glycosyltransferase [Bacteroides sp.]|nr:glycosyltransferase [Bacteroides sp.]